MSSVSVLRHDAESIYKYIIELHIGYFFYKIKEIE